MTLIYGSWCDHHSCDELCTTIVNDAINLYNLQLRLLLPFVASQLRSKYTVIHHHHTSNNNLTSNLGTQTSTDVVLQILVAVTTILRSVNPMRLTGNQPGQTSTESTSTNIKSTRTLASRTDHQLSQELQKSLSKWPVQASCMLLMITLRVQH